MRIHPSLLFVALASFAFHSHAADSLTVPNAQFEEWEPLTTPPVGWDLAKGEFPKEWKVEGRPGEEGILRRVANATAERERFGKSAVFLDGRIFTARAISDSLSGKSVEVSFWAKGNDGRVVTRLRQYHAPDLLEKDLVASTAEVMEVVTTAEWKQYTALVTAGSAMARLDFEANGVALDNVEVRLAETAKSDQPCASVFTIPVSGKAIVIDGDFSPENLSPDEWTDSVGVDRGFMNIQTHSAVVRQTDVRIASDGEKLYICWRIGGRPNGIKNTVKDRDGPVWEDESFEIFINPYFGEERVSAVYQIVVNCGGVVFDQREQPSIGQTDKAWNCEGIEVKEGCKEGVFTQEIAIPLASVELKPGKPFGLNLARNLYYPDEYTTLTGRPYRDYKNMIRCVIAEGAPAVQWGYRLQPEEGRADLYATLRNTATTLRGCTVVLAQKAGTRKEKREALQLNPGETRRLVLSGEKSSARLADLSLDVLDDKGATRFAHTVRFNADNLAAEIAQQSTFRAPAEYSVEFYPVQQKLNLRLRHLASRKERLGKDYGKCLIRIHPRAGKDGWQTKPVLRAVIDKPWMAGDDAHFTTAFAPSENGEYLAQALVHDADGNCVETIAEIIEKRPAPWLGNPLGKDRVVIPPFAPMKVVGNKVTCWGREYEMGGLGLPVRIVAQGEPVLAQPVRLALETEAGVQEAKAGKKGMVFREKSADRVEFEGTGGFENLDIAVKGYMEYDGVIRYEMKLTPKTALAAKRLSLEIPLQRVKYLHGAGFERTPMIYVMERTANDYADPSVPTWGTSAWDERRKHPQSPWQCGYFPETDGLLWSSAGAEGDAVDGSFLPDVWVGTPKNGLAWFADSDRGWNHGRNAPCLELLREKGVYRLRINFIAKPDTIAKERTLVFGLAATPVRPHLTGANIKLKMGDPGGFGNIWQTCQEQGIVCKDFWLAGKYFGAAKREGVVSNVYVANNQHSWGDPDVQSMKYEWANLPFGFYTLTQAGLPYKLKGSQIENYISVTTALEASCVDYVVYRMNQWINEAESGGVYMDNSFPQPSTNVQHAHGAYLREDGQVRYAAHLFDTREVIRRCAVLGYRHGNRSPWFAVHMSHAMLPGSFSYADLYIDGETGMPEDKDYMDRFSIVRLEVFGAGAYGGNQGWLPMLGYGERAKAIKPTRTFLALLKLYDMWIWPTSLNNNLFIKFNTMEASFGIDQDDCAFIGYWEDPARKIMPLPMGVKASYYVRKGKGALAYLSNFNKEKQTVSVTPNLGDYQLAAVRLVDAETSQELKEKTLVIEVHDLRVLRMEPAH